MDPAHILQVQMQMHATGAEKAYIAYWSRTGLSLFCVAYSADFMLAAVHVLQIVLQQFVYGDLDMAGDVLQLCSMHELHDLRDKWVAMYNHLAAALHATKPLEIPGMLRHACRHGETSWITDCFTTCTRTEAIFAVI